MKRIFYLCAFMFFSNSTFSQENTTKQTIDPFVSMSNGSSVTLYCNNKSTIIDCIITNNNSTITLCIEKEGCIYEEFTTSLLTDKIEINTNDFSNGSYDIFIKNDDEIIYAGNVEVTTDNN